MAGRQITVSFPVWSTRVVEWAVLAAVVGGTVVAFMYQYRHLEGQAEYAQIQTTVGSLRTALLIDYMRAAVSGQTQVGQTQAPQARATNPFTVLQDAPPNYAGEIAVDHADEVGPGSWVFDPACPCVGYRPMNPQWLQPAADPPMLWFRLESLQGLQQLKAQRVYRWQGLVIR